MTPLVLTYGPAVTRLQFGIHPADLDREGCHKAFR